MTSVENGQVGNSPAAGEHELPPTDNAVFCCNLLADMESSSSSKNNSSVSLGTGPVIVPPTMELDSESEHG